jgi:phosphoribosylformimino-5-aminoimidazole carboxamide ribotide isomerase
MENIMIIFPAIDIKDGKCVRLIKGDFNQMTSYKKSPFDQAKIYFQSGFKNIHIVDLDGALQGKSSNSNIVKEIIKNFKLKIQIGGGIRTIDDIDSWVKSGVDKVIIGTAAVENKNLLKTACEKFKNKIAISLDVKDGFIFLSGWKKKTNILASDFLKEVQNFGISRIIYTDINKDGTKKGPNIKDTIELSSKFKIPFIISGGISSIEDVKKIKSLNNSNIEGVIVGKSIYDGDIKINELAKQI